MISKTSHNIKSLNSFKLFELKYKTADMNCEYLWAFNSQLWQPTKRQLVLALSALCKEEINRINQFRFQDDYKLCLSGRLMIRKCLQYVTHIKWNNLLLNRSPKGKPVLLNSLKNSEKVFFNISHQGDFTVLAASTRFNVGIDIMKNVKPNSTDVSSFFKLMKRQFVDPEWSYILSHKCESSQLKAFYRLWCLKESYVKATGTGIGTNTASYMRFDIPDEGLLANENEVKPFTESSLYVNNQKQGWTFHEYQLDDKHIAAIAFDTESADLASTPFSFLSIEELLNDAIEINEPDEKWWDFYLSKHKKDITE